MENITKDDSNINTYFDRIFIINLKKNIERKELMLKKLEKLQITNYEFVTAINGYEQPYYNHYTVFRLRNQYFENAGTYGLLMSALKILIFSKIKKFKRILILEDDVIFHKNFINEFNKKIKDIPQWKLLYFGTSLHEWRFTERCKMISNKGIMTSSGSIPGAFGVGIDSSIFNELINSIYITGMPWDLGPLRNINIKYPNQVLIFYPYLTICETEDSSLRESITLRETAKKCLWDLSLYDFSYKK